MCVSNTALIVIIAYLLQVFLLLCIADWMVHCLWRIGRDPDTCSIPYLTALGDLLGTALLALTFHLLYITGDKGGDTGNWEDCLWRGKLHICSCTSNCFVYQPCHVWVCSGSHISCVYILFYACLTGSDLSCHKYTLSYLSYAYFIFLAAWLKWNTICKELHCGIINNSR